MLAKPVAKIPPEAKYVIAVDGRAVQLMAPDTAVRAREMLAMTNPRIIRSSILTLPENPLTNLQVVRLVREGCTNQQIAESLFVSVRTVETHLSHVFAKLGATSRTGLLKALSEER